MSKKSEWESIKPQAIELRKQGNSIKDVHDKLGTPLSTLSGWFRQISLTPEEKFKLEETWKQKLVKSRIEAIKWHNAGKVERLATAANQAQTVLATIPETDASLELALAFLYLGEGAKTSDQTMLGSSSPQIASFYIESLRRLYKVPDEKIKCYLHLRADQDEEILKEYWSDVLKLPLRNFGKTSFDKRTIGKSTYPNYKGVCTINCGLVEIQRRLMYISDGYCDMVANLTKPSAVSSPG